jgi:hypothetical protein
MLIRINSKRDRLEGFSKYTWAKEVHYFDDNFHCAKCLQGTMFRQVHGLMQTNTDIHIQTTNLYSFYICGVAYPYKWTNNMHLALIENPEQNAELQLYNGDVLEVLGAEQYVFDDQAARLLYPDRGPEFLTCRNFQFGVQYFGKGRKTITEPKLLPRQHEDYQPSLF